MSLNKCMFIGNLSSDVALRYTVSGSAVCSFSVAVNDSYRDKQGNQKSRVDYVKVVVWGKLAELCNQHLSKGRQAFIEGRLENSSYEDKQGNKRYKTEINAKEIKFLGERQKDPVEKAHEEAGEYPF